MPTCPRIWRLLFITFFLWTTLRGLLELHRDKRVTFLIGIFSTLEEEELRTSVRSSFFVHRDGRVCSLQEYVKSGHRKKVCQILYTFVIGANPGGPTLILDDSSFRRTAAPETGEPDITWLNIRENMQDGKTQTWFSFAASFTRRYEIDYVAKMDMDTVLDTRALLEFIDVNLPPKPKVPAPDRRKRYGGLLQEFLACGSYIHCQMLRGTVYMSGQFYFVSGDLAEYISSDVFNSSQLRTGFEDLDFGLWVFSYPATVNLVVMSGEMVWVHDFYRTKTQGGRAEVEESISSGRLSLPRRRDMLLETDSCIRSSGAKRCGLKYEKKLCSS